MRRVLANVEASLTRLPRRMIAVTVDCEKDAREVIERSPFFRLASVRGGAFVFRTAVGDATQAFRSTAPPLDGRDVGCHHVVRQRVGGWMPHAPVRVWG